MPIATGLPELNLLMKSDRNNRAMVTATGMADAGNDHGRVAKTIL